jgi:hypothetical protein
MNRLMDAKNLDLLHNYQKGFNELVDNDITIKLGKNTFKVADLFFIYNLIVNKDRSGSDRLTKLFASYISNPNNISKSFYQFYERIDSGKEELFDESFPLSDEMIKTIEFGTLNTNGVLKLQKDEEDRDTGVIIKGVDLKLPNPNFTLITSLIQAASNYKNVNTYQKLLEHINNKNLLIQFFCKIRIWS